MARLTAAQAALLASSMIIFVLGASPVAVASTASFVKRYARRLSPLETVTDFQVQSVLMLAVYILQYLALGGVFEGTNPKHYLPSLPAGATAKERAAAQALVDKRREQVYHEMRAGVLSLVITVALAVLWMYVGEPRTGRTTRCTKSTGCGTRSTTSTTSTRSPLRLRSLRCTPWRPRCRGPWATLWCSCGSPCTPCSSR
jgi:hypothetical protein